VQNLSMPSFSQTDRIAKYNRDFQYIVGAYGVRPLLFHYLLSAGRSDRLMLGETNTPIPEPPECLESKHPDDRL
jgi:hypothetical protein